VRASNRVERIDSLALCEIEPQVLAEVAGGWGTDGFITPRGVEMAANGLRAAAPAAKLVGKVALRAIPIVSAAASCYDAYDGYRGARAAGAGVWQSIGEGGLNAVSQGAYNYFRDR